MYLYVAMHEPEARIQSTEPDDDISLDGHVHHIPHRRIAQVQHRTYTVAPVRVRAVLVRAHDVRIVARPLARRGVDFWIGDPDDGEAMTVHVDRVVGQELALAVVDQDELHGSVVRQFEHVGAVTAAGAVLLGAWPAVWDVVLENMLQHNY